MQQRIDDAARAAMAERVAAEQAEKERQAVFQVLLQTLIFSDVLNLNYPLFVFARIILFLFGYTVE